MLRRGRGIDGVYSSSTSAAFSDERSSVPESVLDAPCVLHVFPAPAMTYLEAFSERMLRLSSEVADLNQERVT